MTRSLLLALSLSAACAGEGCAGAKHEPGQAGSGASGSSDRPSSCPEEAAAPNPLPGVEAKHRTLAFWLERQANYGDVDEVLLTPEELARHDEALQGAVEGRPLGQLRLTESIDEELLWEEIADRLAYLLEKVRSGAYLRQNGDRLHGDEQGRFQRPRRRPLTPSLHRATDSMTLHCGPDTEGLFTERLDPDFDRNKCSTIREGELVQKLIRWDRMWLVRTGYAMGFIDGDGSLGPSLSRDDARSLRAAPRPLTRRSFFQQAFRYLDGKYGWGGHEGGRDCSRLVLDVFEHFGLPMPRHSARQALAGSFSVDLSEQEVPTDTKQTLLREAAKHGIVLMHFPGHIMIYLGETEHGVPMAIHAFSEYMEPCSDADSDDERQLETLRRVDRVAISNLELGKDSSRGSFLERLTRIAVFGKPPGPTLIGASTSRRPAPVVIPDPESECRDSLDSAVFRSPSAPHSGQPLRVIVTRETPPGPAELVLLDPNGQALRPPVRNIGGPPYTVWSEVPSPTPGRWTAIYGDGDNILACEQFTVARSRQRLQATAASWEPRWRWELDTENLYAAFVEQLFDYPIEEDLTWTNLQSLLTDESRNLLYNHLAQNEDDSLRLRPDCADLPYFLRAYFAWKTRLPFGFRRCSRGRAGRPPSCGDLETNLLEREGQSDAQAFARFSHVVRDAVHSASARTPPQHDSTDNYPVELSRGALKPGTVFADPYGHLLVIADWIPQGVNSYGILVGADAQPDGTIGRRRFWRGSFLFTPDTASVGAGFKAWRPLNYSRRDKTISAVDNQALRRSSQYLRWSDQQYRGSQDDFYDRMEALINPRPLNASEVMMTLIDALEESIKRRVVSVNNGIEYNQSHNWSTIEMPSGYAIFETRGAWEDFSTPARDLRLLIALDAVHDFPEAVRRTPERFNLSRERAAEAAEALEEQLQMELGRRKVSYEGSDGTQRELSLEEIMARRGNFEMAYNPNDCIEVRWGAPEGSDERSACRHRAPRSQQEKMLEYRAWFEARQRPPR